jgi:hypothetical protein
LFRCHYHFSSNLQQQKSTKTKRLSLIPFNWTLIKCVIMKFVRITEIEENDNTNSSVKVWMREDYEDKIRTENWPEKKESETHCWEKGEDRVE